MTERAIGELIEEVSFTKPEGLCEKSEMFWEWAADVLRRSGRAHEGDDMLLNLAAHAHHDREQAIEALTENGGHFIEGNVHPAVGLKERASKRLLDLARPLGLTPQARADIGGRSSVSQRELKGNPFSALIKEAENGK